MNDLFLSYVLLMPGGGEIFVILLIVLLLFGANKIPEIAKGLGKGMREFRKASDDIKREMNSHVGDLKDDFKDIKDGLDNTKQILKDD